MPLGQLWIFFGEMSMQVRGINELLNTHAKENCDNNENDILPLTATLTYLTSILLSKRSILGGENSLNQSIGDVYREKQMT